MHENEETLEESAFRLEHFAADALSLDDARFAAKHGSGFLVLSARERLQTPTGPQRTVAIEARPDGASPIASTYRVWPVKKSERSLISRFVSVGRTKRNDIIIPEVSLSKFHAFFVEEGGATFVQDARSRNGTFVDGERVPIQGEGPPKQIRSGCRLKFGAAELLYVDAAGLRRLLIDLRVARR